MTNTTQRYLPWILRNILLLVLLINIPGCIAIPDYCMGGGEYTLVTVDLHVIESDASWQHFSEVRSMEFTAYDQDPDIYSALDRDARYCADGSALALGTTFLHYGVVDAADDSVSQEWKTMNAYSNFFYRFTDVDFYPPKHEFVVREDIYDTLKNVRTGQTFDRRTTGSRLDVKYKSGGDLSPLLSFKATFYDSTKYQLTHIIAPRFDARGNIMFVADRLYYKITGDSTGQRFYYNLNYQEDRLLRLHPDGVVDTLFRFPSSLENDNTQITDMRYTQNAIAIIKNGSLFVLRPDGQELFHTDNAGKFMMSANGSAVTYGNGRYYHRFSDDKQLDLSSFVSDITFAQPYAQQVLVTEKDTVLHIVDVNTEKVIQTVTPDQLPPLIQKKGKYSTTGIYYPLITPDNHLRLIYSDDYIFDDPNDPCD